MTHLYLAASSNIGTISRALDAWDWSARPLNVLLAFPYLRQYRQRLATHWTAKRTMLDSGAFTAFQLGHTIDLAALCSESKRVAWTETVALDVIGDWRGSLRNYTQMVLSGSPAMPVFHIGDPWWLLDLYASSGRKIGLGGLVGRSLGEIIAFCDRVFARCWPWRFHAFGQAREELLLRFPFDSADSTSWMRPATYAGGVTLRGPNKVARAYGCNGRTLGPTLRYSIERLLEFEQRLAVHWQRELHAARMT